MKNISCSCVIIYVIICPLAFGQSVLIDQRCDPTPNRYGDYYYTTDAEGVSRSLGQQFVPTFSALNFVDFYVYSTDAEYVSALIYQDSLSGPFLGQSQGSRVAGYQQARCIFKNEIPLIAGQRYVIEALATGGPAGGNPNYVLVYANGAADSTYAYGNWLYNTTPPRDLWFREGLIVPEPSMFALAGLALGIGWIGMNWVRRK